MTASKHQGTALVTGASSGIGAIYADRLARLGGDLIGSREFHTRPLPPTAERAWGDHCYCATARGRAGYEHYRRDFATRIWRLASPPWAVDAATVDRTAAAVDHPDHVRIVIHHDRWRLSGRRRADL